MLRQLAEQVQSPGGGGGLGLWVQDGLGFKVSERGRGGWGARVSGLGC